MLHVKPSDIRYSQSSISCKFDSRSRHFDVLIGQTLDDLIEGQISVYDIPVISVQKIGDKWVSADNRRLWVFKHLEQIGKCEKIPVAEGRDIPLAKQTSENDGLSVKIRGDRGPGGRYQFAFRVLENVRNEHEAEMQKMRTIISKNEDEMDRSNSLIRQLRSENAKQFSENTDLKARSEKFENKLDRSREINQKNITEYENIIAEKDAELDFLNEKLKNTRADLCVSKPKIEIQYRENTSRSYVCTSYGSLRKTSKPTYFEDRITKLELQLSDLQEQTDTYTAMKARYKDKLWALESENETLRKSKSTTKAAEYEAKIHSMAKELDRVNENYGLLERHAIKIYDDDTRKIEQLKKEIGTIEEENYRLKQTIRKKDKQMTEIRRLTVSLYGLVQNHEP